GCDACAARAGTCRAGIARGLGGPRACRSGVVGRSDPRRVHQGGKKGMTAHHGQPAAAAPRTRPPNQVLLLLREEWSLLVSLPTTVLFLVFGPSWLADL